MKNILEALGFTTLPKMTEFIKAASAYQGDSGDRNTTYWLYTTMYMEFITQKLDAWMFLPCEDGQVLRKPSAGDMQYKVKTNFQEDRDYDDAMNKILFSGWSQRDSEHMDNGVFEIDLAGCWRVDKGLDISNYRTVKENPKTIEDLIDAGVELKLSEYKKRF